MADVVTGSFLPEIGAPDPGALEYINSVWHLIPDGTPFKRYGMPQSYLKDLIREEADAIRTQALFRSAIVIAVELATGTKRPAPALQEVAD